MKYFLDHSKSIPKKNFDQIFFVFAIFSTCAPFFEKNLFQVIMGIFFFEIEIFVLKYGLDHFKSIPTKKLFWPKIFVFAIFSACDPIFRKKAMSSHNGEFFRNQDFRFEIRFGSFGIDSDQKNFFDQNFLS